MGTKRPREEWCNYCNSDRQFIFPNVAREDGQTTDSDILHWNFNLRASCPLGRSLNSSVTDPTRIIYPMIKEERKDWGAKFVRRSDTALTNIANKLSHYKNGYGPYSIVSGPYAAGGNVFTRVLGLYNVGVGGWGACSNDAGRIKRIHDRVWRIAFAWST